MLQSPAYLKELDHYLKQYPMDQFSGKRLLITGATGLLGSALVDLLLRFNEQGGKIKLTLTSRSADKIRARFPDLGDTEVLSWDVQTALPSMEKPDYILHCASPADPVSYSTLPVDTMLTNMLGTNVLLEYTKNQKVSRMIFVSTVEMYGQMGDSKEDFDENYCGTVDHSSARSGYPAAKRCAEVLCLSYIDQYGVDAVIARPCHMFGPTMMENDPRAASSFLKKAVAGEKIVMKSKGDLERSHCYSLDAAIALLFLLEKGECGQAYNIADPACQMTIAQFAQTAAKTAGQEVVFELPTEMESKGYSTAKRAVLASDKLRGLGWRPLGEGCAIEKTVAFLRGE
ncbi:MAG: NAD-dependent epimerase/dehydratase family protein [Eubacteriales bacterium]